MRWLDFNRSEGSYHPPPRITFSFAALRSLRIPDVAAEETFREPIRYPLRSIAGKILRAVRAATGLATTHRRELSFVRLV
jgi:hypothetical protein